MFNLSRKGEPEPVTSPDTVQQEGLEKKVTSSTVVTATAPELKKQFNWVKITETFPDQDFSLLYLWKYFSETGKVSKIGGGSSYSNKIEGAPEIRSIDGIFVPVVAAFESNMEGNTYKVNFDKTSDDKLKVLIECDYDKVNGIKEVLSKAKREVVSIARQYSDLQPLRKIYQHLKKSASSLKISALKHNPNPRMILDAELGVIPSVAKISVVLDGINYSFNFNTEYRIEVTVDCPLDKVDWIDSLLQGMATPNEGNEQKKVRSLEFAVSVSDYRWDMVGGLGEVRQELERYIEWPLQNPELFSSMNTSIPKGILLIGPPGNGKTTIAKILANESGALFYSVSSKDISSKWVGDTEKNWGKLFGYARQDVANGKSVIIFIDEIDGLYTSRGEMDKYTRISFGQFCQEMDGFSDLKNVVVIGATNKYEDLDPALVRPGRFTKKIYLGNPSSEGRAEILDIYMRLKPVASEVTISELVSSTENYSAAMLKELCDTAATNAILRYSSTKGILVKDIRGEMIKEIVIGRDDFNQALIALKSYSNNDE